MEIFALIMMFCIFAGLQHLSNWLFRSKDISTLGLYPLIVSVVIALVIYNWSHNIQSKNQIYIDYPEKYQPQDINKLRVKNISNDTIYLEFNNPSEYQLLIDDRGYYISDDSRPVGFIPLGNTALDSIMIDDNQ